MIDYGAPLKIHDLNIEGLVNEWGRRGITLTKSKIMPLHTTHLEVCKDPARFKVLACGRRWGKSLIAHFIGSAVALQPGRRIWIVGPTYDHTDRVFNELYNLFVQQLKLAVPSKGGRANRVDRLLMLPNGSTIEGKSCERRDQLVGEGLDLIIWDECALVPKGEDIFNVELQSTLIDRKGSAIFISTPRGLNHFYKWFEFGKVGKEARIKLAQGEKLTDFEKGCSDWSSFQFTSYHNTQEFGGYLPKEEIDRTRLTTPEVKFRQENMADFLAIADTAFPEFDRINQIVEWDFKPEFPVYAFMDFNYQTPCTTLYAQVDPNGNVLVFDEYHPPEALKTIHQQAMQLVEKDRQIGNKIQFVIADVAGKQKSYDGRCAWDDLADYGIIPFGRKQKVELGCDLIRLLCKYPDVDKSGRVIMNEHNEPVTYPKLFIHRRCKSLIRALETARAAESNLGFLKEGYIDDGIVDGPLDALRYGLVFIFHDANTTEVIPLI